VEEDFCVGRKCEQFVRESTTKDKLLLPGSRPLRMTARTRNSFSFCGPARSEQRAACRRKVPLLSPGLAENFLANERERAQAQRRGGGRTLVSLDGAEAETRYSLEPADGLTLEMLYERRLGFRCSQS